MQPTPTRREVRVVLFVLLGAILLATVGNLCRKSTTLREVVATIRPTDPYDGTDPGALRDDNFLQMKFAWCPPGTFTMGSPKTEAGRSRVDLKEDQVNVALTAGFWIGVHEVTQSQWATVADSEPWQKREYIAEGPNYPVTYVDWREATRFCELLSEREHKAGRLPANWNYRLPTEAEWEYACRAGGQSRYSFGDDETALPDYEWYADTPRPSDLLHALEVGLKRPNRWGIYDMQGNVQEWCRDLAIHRLPGGIDPFVNVDRDGVLRVVRGGTWSAKAHWCRCAKRSRNSYYSIDDSIGFRVIIERGRE